MSRHRAIRPAAVVVGGANMDIKARSAAPVVAATSNPGHVVRSPGGVGRNVAENLARLGTPTTLVAAVGADALGDELVAATVDEQGRGEHPLGLTPQSLLATEHVGADEAPRGARHRVPEVRQPLAPLHLLHGVPEAFRRHL